MLKLIFISFLLHTLLFISVLNTFFKTRIESELPLTLTLEKPPAHRVLLIIVDGLRAQAVFEENEYITPFMTSIRKERGCWGYSYGAAPTESRIGHNAVLGGFREDPGSVLNAWELYPMKYDTVLTHSRNALLIGPRVVTKWFDEYKFGHVRVIPYPNYPLVKNGDTRSTDLFLSVLNNKSYHAVIPEFGNIFVLLLPHLDEVAHHYRQNYSNKISDVDGRIKNITGIFSSIFPDDKTTYMITSDHGMRYNGGHGSDSSAEISSPFICWGAGINKSGEKKDIENIDIAPLISVLLGINFPTNSRGMVPIDYLNISLQDKYNILVKNLRQIFHIYEKKQRNLVKKILIYKDNLSVKQVREFLSNMDNINETNSDVNLSEFKKLSRIVLDAIDHIYLYYTYNIILCGLLGILLWILYLISLLPDEFSKTQVDYFEVEIFILVSIFYLSSIGLVFYSDSFFFVYFLCPLGSFFLLMQNHMKFLELFYKNYSLPSKYSLFWFTSFYISIFLGFRNQVYFSLTFILMSLLLYSSKSKVNLDMSLIHVWAILWPILCLFSVTTIHDKDPPTVIAGGVLSHIFCCYMFLELVVIKKKVGLNIIQYTITFLQTICSIFSVVIRYDPPYLTKSYRFLLFITLFPIFLIMFTSKNIEVRLFSIFLGMVPFFIVTSFPRDTLMLSIFLIVLLCYLRVELNPTDFINEHVRFLRMWLVMIGLNIFCLIGIINLDNFDNPLPNWLRYDEMMDPCTMYWLYVFRLSIPHILTACIFRFIVLKFGVKLRMYFILLEIFFNTFIFQSILRIRNTGSWSVMGGSLINFFVINFYALFLIFLYGIACILMSVGFPITFNFKLNAFISSMN